MKKLTKTQKINLKKFGINLLKFTAPALAVLFFQLSVGTDIRAAGALAVYALYALIADALKKFK